MIPVAWQAGSSLDTTLNERHTSNFLNRFFELANDAITRPICILADKVYPGGGWASIPLETSGQRRFHTLLDCNAQNDLTMPGSFDCDC